MTDLVVLLGGALLMGIVAGAAGFADALIGTATWLQVASPREVVPLIYLSGIVIHALSWFRFRTAFSWPRFLPFLGGGLVGTPLGLWALAFAPVERIKYAIGWLLVGICGLLLFRVVHGQYQQFRGRASYRRIAKGRGGRAADAAVGWVGGVLGGLSGLSGVFPTLWCGLRGWSPEDQRAVYQPYILVMHSIALFGLVFLGLFDGSVLRQFAICLPALLIGLVLGLWVFAKIDGPAFRFLVLSLLLASGIGLLV